jgi:acyl-CoA thioesterase-2
VTDLEVELSALRGLLDLRRTGVDCFDAGQPAELANAGRLIGGASLAIMLRAAAATVDDGLVPHALHALFIGAGRAEDALHLRVQRLSDGRSFSTRSVTAEQNTEQHLKSTALVSFCRPEDGYDIATPIRVDAPAPESDFTRNPVLAGTAIAQPFDLREVDVQRWHSGHPHAPSRMLWMRLRDELNDPTSLACMLAYASDFGATIAARALVGATIHTPGRFASLNHSIWWHRSYQAGEWLLMEYRPLTAAGSLGLVAATIHTESGVHVATMTQEALMRLAPDAH